MSRFFEIFYPCLWGIIEIWIGFYFFCRFLETKGKLLFAVLLGVCQITFFLFFPNGSAMELPVSIMLLTISGIWTGKVRGHAFLYAVITIEIMNLCHGIVHSMSVMMAPVLFVINPGMVSFLFMAVGSILSMALSMLCYGITKRYFCHEETGGERYAWMLLLPVLLIFFMSEYIGSAIYGNTIEIKPDGKVLNVNPYPVFFMQMLGLISLFCILYAYRKLVESFRLGREAALREREAHFLNQYVKEAKTRYEHTKAFRHDVKNHITIVKELLQNGAGKEALRYLGEMEALAADLSFRIATNNPALDILLGNKLGIAENSGIQVECSLIVPYPCGVKDIDFCIILSNALDNAIAACHRMGGEQRKYIRVAGELQGAFFLIEVINSVAEQNAMTDAAQMHEAIQENDKVYWGTGLNNIKVVAEKYDGAMEVEKKGKIFCLRVLLVIPQQPDSISPQSDVISQQEG